LKTPATKTSLIICLVLALVTFAVYWPVTQHEFIVFDDQQYVTDNTHVQAGLTWPGVVWAVTNIEAANWHPLTWLSHMTDCELFGLYPGGHHLTNVLFHIANALLLFVWLNELTGARWRSAFVAALFAWHPLHVESVAWVAERKDVLSTFFWLLTLMAYTRFAQKSEVRSQKSEAGSPSINHQLLTINYLLALFFFACGLMSKPMVVTLPFVLLLLDFWPLHRIQISNFKFQIVLRLVIEKIPFFALAAAGSAVTYLVQKNGGALSSFATLPPSERVANALVSYVRYISKTLWPADLVIIYPHPGHWPILAVIGTVLVLAAWTGLFVWRMRSNPYLIVGWLWFLGTLVPTIGLVQVGSQSIADRYTYIPGIGLFILIVWGANDLFNLWPERRKFLSLAGSVALAGCLAVTSLQLIHWQNSKSLFLHAIEASTDNFVAYFCLAQAFKESGQKAEALALLRESVKIQNHYPASQFALAKALLDSGQPAEAFTHFEATVKMLPHTPDLRYTVGTFLLQNDRPEDAIRHFTAAIADQPIYPEAHNALGWAYLRESKFDLAIPQFTDALRQKPGFAEAHHNLAFTLTKQNKPAEALPHFAAAAELEPANAEYRFSYGLCLLDNQKPAEAAVQFAKELELTPNETKAHYRLAQALQQQGKFADAVPHYREALRLTPDFPEAKSVLDEILAAHPNLK
jgi:Tfp pilus assembly protein PilF